MDESIGFPNSDNGKATEKSASEQHSDVGERIRPDSSHVVHGGDRQGHISTSRSMDFQDTEMVEKAVRFWTHPSLKSTPPEQKIEYLNSRGVTLEQIHKAWDRIATSDDGNGRKRDSDHVYQTSPSPPPAPQLHPAVAPLGYRTSGNSSPSNDDNLFAPMLLAFGGMLGVGAAASVRWLNGGDFVLFPGPFLHGVNNHEPTQIEAGSDGAEHNLPDSSHECVGSNVDYSLRSEVVDDNPDSKTFQSLPGALESAVELLQTHCEQQERTLQLLMNRSNTQVTDQSMKLLKRDRGDEKKELDAMSLVLVWSKLVEIKSELSRLQSNDRTSALQERLEGILRELETCMAGLRAHESVKFSVDIDAASERKNETAASTPPMPCSTNTTAFMLPETSCLQRAIELIVTENEPSTCQTGCKLLYLYVVNLSNHVHVPRYRKIFTSNESFQRVEQLVGGRELLLAVGFQEKDSYLEWEPKEGDEPADDEAYPLKEAAAALTILKNPQAHVDSQSLLTSVLAVLNPQTTTPRSSTSTPGLESRTDETNSGTLSPVNTTEGTVSPPSTKKLPQVTSSRSDVPPQAPLPLLQDSDTEPMFDPSAISNVGGNLGDDVDPLIPGKSIAESPEAEPTEHNDKDREDHE